jgi:hypothetical protein
MNRYLMAALMMGLSISAANSEDLSRFGPVMQIPGSQWFRPSTNQELRGTLSNRPVDRSEIFTGVEWSAGDTTASLCMRDRGREVALEVSVGKSTISSVEMDGTIHAKDDAARRLTTLIYGIMQSQFGAQYCGHMSKATPALTELK